MELEKLKQILEASLMVANGPLAFDRIVHLFADDGDAAPSREQLRTALEELENDYHHAGIELVKVGSGYRFQARAEVADWVNRLWDEKKPRYSRALLETLAIVAYRQPITRGEIENIRGVAVSTNIMRTLLEREWVRVVGHRDVPGKPAVYATTKQFLDYFNLASLADLPSLAELKDIDDINADLFAEAAPAASGDGEEHEDGDGDLSPDGDGDEADGAEPEVTDADPGLTDAVVEQVRSENAAGDGDESAESEAETESEAPFAALQDGDTAGGNAAGPEPADDDVAAKTG